MNLENCKKGKWIVNTPLGSGKSRAIIQMAKENKFQTPHLIVVDTKEEVDRYKNKLPEYQWYYQTKETLVSHKFKKAILALEDLKKDFGDMYVDFVIDGLKSKLKRKDEEEITSDKGLIITKAMFNEYLRYQYSDPLSRFKTITIDELSNLEILSSFPLKDEYTCLLSNEPNFHEDLLKSKLKQISCPAIDKPKTFFEELVASNGVAHLKKIRYGSSTEIVLKNTKLIRLLNSEDLNIHILDATADFNSYFYNSLKGYTKIETQNPSYQNLCFRHIEFNTGYKNKISKFRINYRDSVAEIQEKLKIIKNLNITSPLLFSNKDTIEILKKHCKHTTLDYFYSGNDIGTNKYRNYTDLCILYGQKINKEYTNILSYYFKEPAENIQDNLIAARTIQLVGRTAIRTRHISKDITVSIVNFPELDIDKVLEYYHRSHYIKGELIVEIEEKTDTGKVMKYISKNNLNLHTYPNNTKREKLREIISSLGITPKDSKAMSNLISRVIAKLKESQEL